MAGIGQEGLPNTQRPVEHKEPPVLESLGEDCNELITPNVGKLSNQAGCMCVKMPRDLCNRKPNGVC